MKHNIYLKSILIFCSGLVLASCNPNSETKTTGSSEDSTAALDSTAAANTTPDTIVSIPAAPDTAAVAGTRDNGETQLNNSSQSIADLSVQQLTGVGIKNSGSLPVAFYFSTDGTNIYQRNYLKKNEARDYKIPEASVYLIIYTAGNNGEENIYRTIVEKGKRYHLVFDYSDNKWKVQDVE